MYQRDASAVPDNASAWDQRIERHALGFRQYSLYPLTVIRYVSTAIRLVSAACQL